MSRTEVSLVCSISSSDCVAAASLAVAVSVSDVRFVSIRAAGMSSELCDNHVT